jgi:hypothetical protein
MSIEKNMNEQQRQEQMIENSTKLFSFIVSSSSLPDRTRTVINVIYILGIIFMIIVFLVLLWINLYSRRCWCWHDTFLIHRFNRQWLIKHSMNRNTDMSSSNNQQQQISFTNDELNS